MKTFSLGFILIFSIIALVLHIELKSIKEQINQKIDVIFFEIQHKIKQKLESESKYK